MPQWRPLGHLTHSADPVPALLSVNGGDRAPLQAVEKWKILRVTKAAQSFSSAGEIVGGLFQSRRWGALQKVGTRPSRRQGAKEVLDSSQAGGIPKDPLQSLLCCPPFRAWACLSAWGQQGPSLQPTSPAGDPPPEEDGLAPKLPPETGS